MGGHGPPKLLRPLIIIYKNKLHFYKNKLSFNNCINWPPKKFHGTQSTLSNLAMIQYNTPLLVFMYIVQPTQIKQTFLTKPNKCLVAMCPYFLIFYTNKNAKKCYVVCNQYSTLKCIVHVRCTTWTYEGLTTHKFDFFFLFYLSFSLANIIFYFWI